MVPEEVKEYYNIVEKWSDDNSEDIGNYLYDNSIKYDIRVTTDIEIDVDFNWMATQKKIHFVVYTAKLTAEEALMIKLKYPTINMYKPKLKEPVSAMAKRVLML